MPNDGAFPETRTELQRLQQLELQFVTSQPDRAQVLRQVLDWRKSWHTLAEKLQSVRTDKTYLAWGFRTFEEYTRDELGLKLSEVHKLLGALTYAQTELAQADGTVPALPLPAVEVAKAAGDAGKAGKLDSDVVQEIKAAVLAGEPVASVKRQFKAQLQASEEERRTPDDSLREAEAKARKAAATLREVLVQLADARRSHVTGTSVADQLETLIERTRGDLDRLLEAPDRQGAAKPKPLFTSADETDDEDEADDKTPSAPPPAVPQVPAVIDAKLISWAERIGATHGATLQNPFPPVGEMADKLFLSCPVHPDTLTAEVKLRLHAEYTKWFHVSRKAGTTPMKRAPSASPKPAAAPKLAKSAPAPKRRTGRASPDDSRVRVVPASPFAKASRRKATQPGLFA